MRTAKGDSRCDRRVPEPNPIDFVRRDILASTDDDVFDPASQVQIAVRIQKSLIASAEPPIHKGVRVGFGIIFVSTKYVGSLNRDLAPLVSSRMVPVFLHDADAEPGAPPNRASLPVPWRQGIRGHLVSGFRHAVSL